VCVCGGGGLKDFFDQEVIRIRTPVFELTILYQIGLELHVFLPRVRICSGSYSFLPIA
jgi:hypothetical protein